MSPYYFFVIFNNPLLIYKNKKTYIDIFDNTNLPIFNHYHHL